MLLLKKLLLLLLAHVRDHGLAPNHAMADTTADPSTNTCQWATHCGLIAVWVRPWVVMRMRWFRCDRIGTLQWGAWCANLQQHPSAQRAGGLPKMREAGFTADMLAAHEERPAADLDEWLENPSTSGRDAEVVRPRHAAGCPATQSRASMTTIRLRGPEDGRLLVVSAITVTTPYVVPSIFTRLVSIWTLTPTLTLFHPTLSYNPPQSSP